MSVFSWPWQYDFPPFFTLQPNQSTREKQLDAWASLILDYCQHHKIYTLDVLQCQNSPLFFNSKLNSKFLNLLHLLFMRVSKDEIVQLPANKFVAIHLVFSGRFSLEGILAVLELLEKRKHIEWQDKSKKRCQIFWRTPEEWGKLIYDYIVANGMLNSVCTIFELIHGDDTGSESFHDLDKDILLKSLRHLQAQGHCELMSVAGNEGVNYAVKVTRGQTLQTKYGAVRHEYLIDKPYGVKIMATKGYVHVLRLTPELWCRTLEHRTQILYPPDVALATLSMDLKPGEVVLEAGTGSGAASHAFARAVAPHGHLYTFDIDPKRVEAAKVDLERNNMSEFVTVTHRDACEDGFGMENMAHAVFLDMPCPWKALPFAKTAFNRQSEGKLVSFSPCIEQVTRTCEELRRLGFVRLETMEIVPRKLKVVQSHMQTLIPREAVEGSPNNLTENGSPPVKKCRKSVTEDQEEADWIAIAHPPQQPTHTGYLTVAVLPPSPNAISEVNL